MRPAHTGLSAGQRQIVDRLLARTQTPGMSAGEAASLIRDIENLGDMPVRDVARTEATEDRPKVARQVPGWPDSPQVMTLASIVREVLASTDDIPPEEDFATMLLQKLDEAGLDTSTPIMDFYA